MSYFSVLVELESEQNGRPKKIRELYLTDALSVTEAEANIVTRLKDEGTTQDFQVTKVSETKYLAVV
jgi:hypothetical protein|tara:strand:- start:101 stop:301 length:201 start_codon:yes stop_codon:yes gene_type:complete